VSACPGLTLTFKGTLLAAILTENNVSPSVSQNSSRDLHAKGGISGSEQLAAELGIWLNSIEKFSAGIHPHPMVQGHGDRSVSIVPEFRIVRSTMMRCTRIAIALLFSVRHLPAGQFEWATVSELEEIVAALQDACSMADALAMGEVSSGVWHSYRRMLLSGMAAANTDKLTRAAENAGNQFLPEQFLDLLKGDQQNDPERALLAGLMPRFGRILKWLSVVGDMLRQDEPLKMCVLIFSHVDGQLTELTRMIDAQLNVAKAESEIFSALDAASYTASVELKKVRSKELPGLLHLDAATSVYARMETAYSLLNDSLQQIVATFAKALDPAVDLFALFPEFEVKRQNSLQLRSELWRLARTVRAAEARPESEELQVLYADLHTFMSGAAKFLFYKDTESVERFVEEISLTREKVDIAPLLHRFGAFLETLLGQVNLRVVLQDQPFVPPVP
jgi:hypothetical protein